jgi:hypothetical protein
VRGTAREKVGDPLCADRQRDVVPVAAPDDVERCQHMAVGRGIPPPPVVAEHRRVDEHPALARRETHEQSGPRAVVRSADRTHRPIRRAQGIGVAGHFPSVSARAGRLATVYGHVHDRRSRTPGEEPKFARPER